MQTGQGWSLGWSPQLFLPCLCFSTWSGFLLLQSEKVGWDSGVDSSPDSAGRQNLRKLLYPHGKVSLGAEPHSPAWDRGPSAHPHRGSCYHFRNGGRVCSNPIASAQTFQG